MNTLHNASAPAITEVRLEPSDIQRLTNLCGPLDKNLQCIEKKLGVEINHRGNAFKVIGNNESVSSTREILHTLYAITQSENISLETVHLHLHEADSKHLIDDKAMDTMIKTKRRIISGKSPGQRDYLRKISTHDISFGIGPAGTGKTYLAVACAVSALELDCVRRIILVRPAIEAGENLGFLPGDLAQKIDPYLRPLYDALYEMLGAEQVTRHIESNVIEIVPLAFMRGRTLNESFIILDEAQNTTAEQMKMFLTRIGFGSTAVITGDITQIDLPAAKNSGLRHVVDILKGETGISFTFFNTKDIVRHSLVARILAAYERYENKCQ